MSSLWCVRFKLSPSKHNHFPTALLYHEGTATLYWRLQKNSPCPHDPLIPAGISQSILFNAKMGNHTCLGISISNTKCFPLLGTGSGIGGYQCWPTTSYIGKNCSYLLLKKDAVAHLATMRCEPLKSSSQQFQLNQFRAVIQSTIGISTSQNKKRHFKKKKRRFFPATLPSIWNNKEKHIRNI